MTVTPASPGKAASAALASPMLSGVINGSPSICVCARISEPASYRPRYHAPMTQRPPHLPGAAAPPCQRRGRPGLLRAQCRRCWRAAGPARLLRRAAPAVLMTGRDAPGNAARSAARGRAGAAALSAVREPGAGRDPGWAAGVLRLAGLAVRAGYYNLALESAREAGDHLQAAAALGQVGTARVSGWSGGRGWRRSTPLARRTGGWRWSGRTL